MLQEPPELRERIYEALEQIYVASHRVCVHHLAPCSPSYIPCVQYPHTQLPVTIFHQYHLMNIPTVQPGSLRTIATLPFFPPSDLVYFGCRLSISPPLLACSAALILTNRREQRPLGVLPNRPVPPVTQELNAFRATALGVEVPRAGGGREHFSGLPNPLLGSSRWDHTFARMRAVASMLNGDSRASTDTWFRTMYYRGMFSGKWLGRILVIICGY